MRVTKDKSEKLQTTKSAKTSANTVRTAPLPAPTVRECVYSWLMTQAITSARPSLADPIEDVNPSTSLDPPSRLEALKPSPIALAKSKD
jgi:hypothetical protein